MKTILVLGATGAMGRYLVPRLAQDGYFIEAVALDEAQVQIPKATYYQFNAKDDALLEKFFADKKYDAIVDFMLYSNDEFTKRYKLLLKSTTHYIFLSSYRVYADLAHPIRETSPRLLEASQDDVFLGRKTEEYALYKAYQEDILRNSGYANWTILRPTMVYSTYRYQLVGLEASTFLYRAQHNKPVILPENAMDKHAAMTWAGDVAKMISGLLFNEKAYKETFTVGSSEKNTWSDVLHYYQNVLGFDCILVSKKEYEKIFYAYKAEWYKHLYDRFYDRVIDNTKLLSVTGLKQSDFMPLGEGLKRELESIRGYQWTASQISESMDRYLNMKRGQK